LDFLVRKYVYYDGIPSGDPGIKDEQKLKNQFISRLMTVSCHFGFGIRLAGPNTSGADVCQQGDQMRS
jgi:hypothetical protein